MRTPFVTMRGPRLTLRPFRPDDASKLLEIQWANREALDPWMPSRSPDFYTETAQGKQVQADLERWQADLGYAFAVEYEGMLIGRVALSNVVRGAWQSATLGYWVDSRFQSRGFATEAVTGTLKGAFRVMELHRVQAAIMLKNAPSLRVVEKLGFFYEGLAPRYLQIAGQWEDHKIFSLTVETFRDPPGWTLES